MRYLLDLILLLPLLIVFWIESLVKLFIPKKRKSVAGEIVLITGAGHGIGRLTAYEFAKLNTKLVLWDINKVTALLRCLSFVALHSGDGSTLGRQPSFAVLCEERRALPSYCCHFFRFQDRHELISVKSTR